MGLFHQIANYFKPHEPKTIIVTGAEPGDVIPIESPSDKIIFLPCPLSIRLTGACVCMTCDFISRDCPMEIECRNVGCEASFIHGCTNYVNSKDKYYEEKRRVFKEGCHFNDSIFRFGKSKTDTTI